jgi:SSS family solute:Na+ symporter
MPLSMLLSFVLYFSILLGIGLAAHRRNTTAEDFMVGGRSLSYWVTALSAHASDMSSWLFMGLPMLVFTQGLSHGWIALGLMSGMFINWQFIAPKLRVITEQHNCYTLSDFFEARFQDRSGALRVIRH